MVGELAEVDSSIVLRSDRAVSRAKNERAIRLASGVWISYRESLVTDGPHFSRAKLETVRKAAERAIE